LFWGITEGFGKIVSLDVEQLEIGITSADEKKALKRLDRLSRPTICVVLKKKA